MPGNQGDPLLLSHASPEALHSAGHTWGPQSATSGLLVIRRRRTDLWPQLRVASTGGGRGTSGCQRWGEVGKAAVFWQLIGVFSECPYFGLGPLGSRLGRVVSNFQV